MGPSGCGKSTLAEPRRRSRPARRRIGRGRGHLARRARRERARDHAAQPRRHRVPVLQPLRDDDRARERADAGAARWARGGASPSRGRATCSTCSGSATRRSSRPTALSGGQRQRLAIARALSNEPTILLADEPTGALDSDGGNEILELFRRLHAGGQTILLVTHDQPVADAAQRIVRMRDGRVVDAWEPHGQPRTFCGRRGRVT